MCGLSVYLSAFWFRGCKYVWNPEAERYEAVNPTKNDAEYLLTIPNNGVGIYKMEWSAYI